ncbi:MAG: DUF262 domain-containing protein [Synergistaceae bacterium]|nr:DUF262 domain-containing protein [Synergistaceae bacterium]
MANANSTTIINLLENINKEQTGGIFLPHIQRDFVWDEEKIYSLMDSLMRGYPIGAILLWRTQEPVNYRPFVSDYVSNFDFESQMQNPDENIRAREYVLDGQQRLQSLFIALNGSYEEKELYFNIQSSPLDEEGYEFRFMTKPQGFWVKVRDLVSPKISQETLPSRLKNQGIIASTHTEAEADRMGGNAMRLHRVFNMDTIPVITLGYTDNISTNEIAEVFVRINSEGAVLEKADLLMALIRNQWAEAGRELSSINSQLENMGFRKTRDFVLRSFQAMLGEGTVLDLKIFSKEKVQEKLKDRKTFASMRTAICETLDFVSKFEFIGGAKNVPSRNPLLLLVCHRYHHPEKWSDEQARNFLLFAFLSKAFTSVSAKTMDELVKTIKEKFNIQAIKAKMAAKNQGMLGVNASDLLERVVYKNTSSVHLALRLLLQGKSGFPHGEPLEIDHIFPVSLCKKAGIKAAQYHQLANLTLLTHKENSDKANMPPAQWFHGREKEYLNLHSIPEMAPDILDIKNFDKFIQQRKAIIDTELSVILGSLS